jgi:small subunit ribosomal protein S4
MVVHGHVQVNQNKLDRPSYQVVVGDTINLTSKALKIPAVAGLLEEKNKFIPKWLAKKAAVGKVTALPEREDIESDVNENLIVEYYSR